MPALLPVWSATGSMYVPDPSKISVGWLLGEKPPHEYMNWWQNSVVNAINHVLARGVPEWDSTVAYQTGALAKTAAGLVYRAITASTNQAPASSPSSWTQVSESASALSTGTLPNARLNGSYTNVVNMTASGVVTAASFVGAGANLTGLNASALTSGVVPDGRLSGSYTGVVSLQSTGTISANLFSGSGASLTNLNASQVTSGTLNDARLPSTMSGKVFSSAIRVPAGNDSASGINFGAATERIVSDGSNFRVLISNSSKLLINESEVTAVNGAVFTGPGGGLTDLNASSLASGTVPNSRLSGSYTNINSITVSGTASVGSLSASGSIGTDSSIGGILYVNSPNGYFRGPNTLDSPLYVFNGDVDTGMGRPGNDVLGLYAGGQEVLRIGNNVQILGGGSFSGPGSALTSLSASALASGTVPTARLGSTNNDDVWVRTRMSNAPLGGLGSIALLGRNSGTGFTAGQSYAGSGLRYSGFVRDNNVADINVGSTAPSGTWMALSTSDNGDDRSIGLFLRVS